MSRQFGAIFESLDPFGKIPGAQMVVTNKSQKFGHLPFGRVNKVTQHIW